MRSQSQNPWIPEHGQEKTKLALFVLFFHYSDGWIILHYLQFKWNKEISFNGRDSFLMVEHKIDRQISSNSELKMNLSMCLSLTPSPAVMTCGLSTRGKDRRQPAEMSSLHAGVQGCLSQKSGKFIHPEGNWRKAAASH